MPTVAQSPSSAGAVRSSRFKGCSVINDYEVLSKLGEGTFGEVHKARAKANGKLFALKKILMHNERDGFPITALREIKLLKTLSHVNILNLESMAVERASGGPRRKAIMYMVTPYMDHDLSGLLENPEVKMSEAQIKCYMLQVLDGVRFLHNAHILHRDMKAANLLINNRGILQIADFGLARYFDESPPKPGRGCGEAKRDYTGLVVTRWYRAPELLLGLRRYTCAIDMWGVGCVFGEFFKKRPILSGKSDLNQAQIIFELVGSPNDETMPGWNELPGCEGVKSFDQSAGNLQQQFRELSPQALSLLSKLLRLDWRRRINAYDALHHPYFKTEPLPARPGDLPTYNDSHELDRRRFRDQKAAPPPAPAGGAVGMGPEGEWGPNANGASGRDYQRIPYGARDSRAPPPWRPDDRGARDRGLPYDSRRPPTSNVPPADRRPGWARPQGPESLPPRPPPGASAAPQRESPHGSMQQSYRNRQDQVVDSYRPGKDRDGPPPREYRDRDPAPRDDWYDRDRERDRDRDRDRGRRAYEDRGRRPPYDDRDRRDLPYDGSFGGTGWPRQEDRDHRSTRSRSPDRRERDRDREANGRRG